MAKLKLSKAIDVPGSSQAEFDIPDVATLGLFRGVKLPLTVDANSMKVDINLEAAAVTQLISNLLQIPRRSSRRCRCRRSGRWLRPPSLCCRRNGKASPKV